MIAPRRRAESWTELLADWLGCSPGAVSETQARDFRGFVMDEVTFTDAVGWPEVLTNFGWSLDRKVDDFLRARARDLGAGAS